MSYCTQAQIETTIPAPVLNDALDDDRDGTADTGVLTSGEEPFVIPYRLDVLVGEGKLLLDAPCRRLVSEFDGGGEYGDAAFEDGKAGS